MKKIINSLLFAAVLAFTLAACTEEIISPQGGTGDKCQFGGPGCEEPPMGPPPPPPPPPPSK